MRGCSDVGTKITPRGPTYAGINESGVEKRRVSIEQSSLLGSCQEVWAKAKNKVSVTGKLEKCGIVK